MILSEALRQLDRHVFATWFRQVRSSPDLRRGEIILLGTRIGGLVFNSGQCAT
jgi:hypothetical protein